uniref:hypothetical protein n=1 Tax=Arsenophonus nasoniae TaxID=638 RepID=UPI00143831B0|nr:hypothetical protein [Arsenophonus nasoniae]
MSNRKRGKLLPKVYKAIEMTARKTGEPRFSVLMKGFLRTDPYKCILCGDRLLFTGAQMGKKQRNCCQKDCITWRKAMVTQLNAGSMCLK